MSQPLFSIITPAYNAASTIGRTLASVDGQTFTNYEHVIVDGASTDATAAVVEAAANPRRRFVSAPDEGVYDAMNKGISLTKGKYLIFLNAGDAFHAPDTLAVIADAIRKGNTPGVVYGQTILVDKDGNTVGERHLKAPASLSVDSFKDGMVVCHQAFVVLRRIAGFYNLRYRFSADYDWCIRCLQHSRRVVGLGDTVVCDYLNEGLTTRNHRASLRERFSIMAYYYGTLPTLWRHAGFMFRYLRRRFTNPAAKQ